MPSTVPFPSSTDFGLSVKFWKNNWAFFYSTVVLWSKTWSSRGQLVFAGIPFLQICHFSSWRWASRYLQYGWHAWRRKLFNFSTWIPYIDVFDLKIILTWNKVEEDLSPSVVDFWRSHDRRASKKPSASMEKSAQLLIYGSDTSVAIRSTDWSTYFARR